MPAMNVKCEIFIDLEAGDYDVRFHNLAKPGEPLDYLHVRKVLRRILQDFDDRRMKELDDQRGEARVVDNRPADGSPQDSRAAGNRSAGERRNSGRRTGNDRTKER
jgi:hypothetical protein